MKTGYKFSAEHRAKISANHAKYWLGKKRNLSNSHVKQKRKPRPDLVLRNKTMPVSEETRRKIGVYSRLRFLGERNPRWKGGITPVNAQIRHSPEYKAWRKAVFERDKYKCVWCRKSAPRELNADHIKPFASFPELRFAIDNGRTLCRPCHETTDTFPPRLRRKKP